MSSTGPAIYCKYCGYPLGGLTQPVCPECGKAFDPNDSASVQLGRAPEGIDRWLAAPLGWPSHAVTVVTWVLSVRDSFDLPWPSRLDAIAAVLWLVLLPYWLMRLITFLALRSFYGRAAARIKGSRFGWWVIPVAFVSAAMLKVFFDM